MANKYLNGDLVILETGQSKYVSGNMVVLETSTSGTTTTQDATIDIPLTVSMTFSEGGGGMSPAAKYIFKKRGL